jgi:hypothetical protein
MHPMQVRGVKGNQRRPGRRGLEAVDAQDFLDCSDGFRPHRSPHHALDALWYQTMRMGGGG